ncbi:hypothetical protein NQ318_020260 [Aromia moschata]|uniref:Uncharacterized protein n=1 Tax=Aromia moschata TaxID=1265417 RepID=A0AAV8Z9R8_9CUCU|nr:hypothetical protein NQ318_020260 [Aromia moschata]
MEPSAKKKNPTSVVFMTDGYRILIISHAPPPLCPLTENLRARHRSEVATLLLARRAAICFTSFTPLNDILLFADGVRHEPPEVLMCPRCQEQFTDVQEYFTHKAECDKKAIKHDDPAHSDPEDMVVSEEDDDDETGGKRLERMRRHRQDAANNNSVEENSPDEGGQRLGFPFPIPAAAPGHVTLEALQNTKVAVAQFAATAMANNADNEAALQELAVLQSTLFTLQHQQVLQLQLINQLQHQLQIDRTKEEEESSPNEAETTPVESPPASQTIPVCREPTPASLPPPISQPIAQQPPVSEPLPQVSVPSSLPPQIQPPMCSISSSLASTIITHTDEQPSLDEPNTLEMLQKRAQEVLENASQGLLATNLADELAFRKSKGSMSPYDSKGGTSRSSSTAAGTAAKCSGPIRPSRYISAPTPGSDPTSATFAAAGSPRRVT